MRETPYLVRPTDAAVLAASRQPTVGKRTMARQHLLDRAPFPARFATYDEAARVAAAAGPEFEVVLQS